MNIAYEILKRAYEARFTIAVDDGDGVKNVCETLEEAWRLITDVEQAHVYIRQGDEFSPIEWMMVIPELADDENAADLTAGGWIDRQWNDLMKME